MLGFIFIMLVAGGISLLARGYVKKMFSRYSRVGAQGGYSGAQVAAQILNSSGIHDVSIHEQEGMLGDHYDPLRKRLVLSLRTIEGAHWPRLEWLPMSVAMPFNINRPMLH